MTEESLHDCFWGSRTGSSASHVRLACLQCGTQRTARRQPDEIARGSSSATHRVCKDCGGRVYEMPTNSSRSRLETVCFEDAPRGSISDVAVNVSQEQMWATGVTAASFVAQATAGRHEGRHSEIDDEEDLQVTQSSCPATAVSAKASNVQWHPQESRSGEQERDGKRPARELPQLSVTMTRIDSSTDPRVFAVLDDGCNQTCHTPAFIDHMRCCRTLPLVGGCKATGRRGIHFGLALPQQFFGAHGSRRTD